MDPNLYSQVEEIFAAASQLPADDRSAFLIEACRGSDVLLEHVRRLLATEESPHFLDEPALTEAGDWLSLGLLEPTQPSSEDSAASLRVFITASSQQLDGHLEAACDVARELHFEVVRRVDVWPTPEATDTSSTPDEAAPAVSRLARRVARCDVVLALVDWRRGTPPTPEQGGDGLRPWLHWELRSAFECGKPVAVLMTSQQRPDGDSAGRTVMGDFRGELARLAVTFHVPPSFEGAAAAPAPSPEFRRLVRRQLLLAQPAEVTEQSPVEAPFALRPWEPYELPERPYPLLLPYTHPDLLAGRDHDLASLRRLLAQPIPILGLAAPSGTGKSSLLTAGLLPALRRDGQPAALERHPLEPGIARRLIVQMLDDDDGLDVADHAPQAFIDHLQAIAALASHKPPVLVIDAFELLLRPSGRQQAAARRARATLGLLMAASAQRLPGRDAPPCRWLLACRQEAQGELLHWLTDLLDEARSAGIPGVERLPHNFSEATRFHSWPLLPVGTPSSGSRDPHGESTATFRRIIEQPLQLLDDNARPRYPWRFVGDGTERLARAFAAARLRRPTAPLVPELQAVLALLLDDAGEATGEQTSDRIIEVRVPDDVDGLLDRALERHLRRALDLAFPLHLERQNRRLRVQALLILRQLADPCNSHSQTLEQSSDSLSLEILGKLSTPRTRLVVLEERDTGWTFVLSHHRLAEVVIQLFNTGRFAGFEVDEEVLALRRFVTLRCALFRADDGDQATAVDDGTFQRLSHHHEVLLWDDHQRRWWAACQARWHRQRRRRRWFIAGFAVLLAMVIGLAADWSERRVQRRGALERVAAAEPTIAFAALAELTAADRPSMGSSADLDEDILRHWRRRPTPFDLFDRGLQGVEASARAAAVVRCAERSLELLPDGGRRPESLAKLLWALDFFAVPDPDQRRRALDLRRRALQTLRPQSPLPPWPAQDDPQWAWIPAGTYQHGDATGKGREPRRAGAPSPAQQVTLGAYRMLIHEVTQGEFRRLFHRPTGDDDLPVTGVTWYQAYVYAAWLGGRLPTEAEWEYAAKAGCEDGMCVLGGGRGTLNEVAWWGGNSLHPVAGERTKHPIMQKRPNPWGLYDMLGNAAEWTANWYGGYTAHPQTDPPGPLDHASGLKTWRGLHFLLHQDWAHPSGRGFGIPGSKGMTLGFRVVLPENLRPPAAPEAR